MKQTMFMEKYPIFTLEIEKSECRFKSVEQIVSYFKTLIEEDAIAAFIGEFDHFAHTGGVAGGEIAPEILDAKLVVFCFGQKLPNPQMLAARPRSIGVCERKNDFVISFLEAPVPAINQKMEEWAKSLAL
ncbi:MAG: hypothetical protein JHC37_06105 [Campylobacteraceae bacterium]|jgi:hypothetical protein|nr:hypothetical protein [Campylobacteraceae bacterium]